MDIQTINQEEFDQLHPAMKEYLKAGIDTNRYGSDLVTENSFFKMDLYNSNPEELDPNLLLEQRKLEVNLTIFLQVLNLDYLMVQN